MPTPIVLVYRDSLSLPPLTIGDDIRPFVGGPESDQALVWGGRVHDRQFASSPWTHGDVLVGARMKNSQLELRFIVLGDSETELHDRWAETDAAFSAFTYQLDLLIGSVTKAYTAYVADIALALDRFHFKAFAARAAVVVPVMPLAIGA